MLGNAAFLVWGGFTLLNGAAAEEGRGLFLVLAGLAHLALGAPFLLDRGDRHPFGLLAVGTGIAAVTMAIPVQLGGPIVPIAWAAEAAALAWVYARRDHRYSAGAAIVLGALAVGHLLAFEYPIYRLTFEGGIQGSARPFVNAAGGTLVFLLLALVVAGALARRLDIRVALAFAGALLVIYALPFELSGLALLGGWAAIFVLCLAADRAVATLRGVGDWLAELTLPALLAGGLALAYALAFELPLDRLGDRPPTPFSDSRTLAAAILIGASLLAALLVRAATARRGALVAAFGIATYLMPFELRPAATVVAWSFLIIGLLLVGRRDHVGARTYRGVAALVGVLALALALGAVAPPERLFVDARLTIDHPPFWSGATAALGALALALAVAYRLGRPAEGSRWLAAGAGALAVYLLSVGVVDEFQRYFGDVALEQLRKGAQVSLSILWATLGGAAFVAGVVRWVAPLRVWGLALLALATTKVFLYDLASLDATYKVGSFIGLGVLLLASSYAYQRLKPRDHGERDRRDTPGPASGSVT